MDRSIDELWEELLIETKIHTNTHSPPVIIVNKRCNIWFVLRFLLKRSAASWAEKGSLSPFLDEDLGFTGAPQFGHAAALSETCFWHS